jgi:hypothetical protein
LRKRFSIQRVCVVADRGMISAETIAELEARGLCYILGVRERSDKLVRDFVLGDPAPFIPLTIAKRGKEIDYEAKAVMLAGRRYIVCRNREEMKKDAAARAAILAALERQLKKGDKTLVGNKGYRRFLATPGDDHFVIDRAKAEEDAKFDGIFVLARTPISRRSKPCFATNICGWWSARSEPRKACSPRARFSTSSTRPFAAMCRVAFSPWC